MITLKVTSDVAATADRTEYISGKYSKNESTAYLQTKELSIRYLASRDLNLWLAKLNGKNALDYGSGLGFSVDYLLKHDFKVHAADINPEMIQQAKNVYPSAEFTLVSEQSLPYPNKSFDLVFSSYVLFEMNSLEKIITYLQHATRVLKDDGYIIAIIASQNLYDPEYKSQLYNTGFRENYMRQSGSLVKMSYNEINMTFTDYFWTETDYRTAFANAGLKICAVHYPLGNKDENYPWQDELTKSPLLLILAVKNN